ncbi:MAG TPA: hypothetical protein VFV79_00070 [Saprospiraceae bacterium]|nr:hypothetical protein [Saprospiraceae bacterium]
MKNSTFSLSALVISASAILIFSSCSESQEDLVVTPHQTKVDIRSNQNSQVFPITSHPLGKSYAEWSSEWWIHVLGSDCTTNPIPDLTGANTAINQSGPVYFLFGTPGGNATRTATIPAGKPVLFPLVNIYWQEDCPSPIGNGPEPSQTLQEFLTASCAFFTDQAGDLSASLDGVEFSNLSNYRATSDLFTYTGNPDLGSCFDGCINGLPQQAVTDGYWLMLKPLSPGSHTLHFTGGYPDLDFLVDVTYELTVE